MAELWKGSFWEAKDKMEEIVGMVRKDKDWQKEYRGRIGFVLEKIG